MDDQRSPDPSLPELPRLGPLIAHYRDICGLSQMDFGRIAGKEQAHISKIEAGHITRPNNDTLAAFASVFADGIDGGDAARIFEHLVAARDNVPIKSQPLPELLRISDELLAYPYWFRLIALRAVTGLLDSLRAIYKRML